MSSAFESIDRMAGELRATNQRDHFFNSIVNVDLLDTYTDVRHIVFDKTFAFKGFELANVEKEADDILLSKDAPKNIEPHKFDRLLGIMLSSLTAHLRDLRPQEFRTISHVAYADSDNIKASAIASAFLAALEYDPTKGEDGGEKKDKEKSLAYARILESNKTQFFHILESLRVLLIAENRMGLVDTEGGGGDESDGKKFTGGLED